MGKLKPGATYIYERVDNVVYAREAGSLDREAIGWDYVPGQEDRTKMLEERKLWLDILDAAKTNESLHEAIERVKILYHLSKKNAE
jgi:hypothetical protein